MGAQPREEYIREAQPGEIHIREVQARKIQGEEVSRKAEPKEEFRETPPGEGLTETRFKGAINGAASMPVSGARHVEMGFRQPEPGAWLEMSAVRGRFPPQAPAGRRRFPGADSVCSCREWQWGCGRLRFWCWR